MEKVTLYKKDAKGQIRLWSIEPGDDVLIIEHGVLNGETQTKYEDVDYGKAGRTVDEQIDSRMNSRINKKMDAGYKSTIDDAKNGNQTNRLGLPKPMLAHRIDKIKNISYKDSFVQKKYDGHRCLIRKIDGKLIAYSRNGKIINSIPEILSDIDPSLDEGVTLDGELYLHGLPLQKITSLIKRKQSETKLLKFICYDIISDDEYSERFNIINYILNFGERVEVAPTMTNVLESDIPQIFELSISLGYEGLILRLPDYGYESGKRSRGLIKIKSALLSGHVIDDDFRVKNILESKDGWARLVLETKECREFTVSAPGTMNDKRRIFIDKEKFIGLLVTVVYSGLTIDNIPFHPIATRFVEEL